MFIKITAIDDTVFIIKAEEVNSCVIFTNSITIHTKQNVFEIKATPEEIKKFTELFN